MPAKRETMLETDTFFDPPHTRDCNFFPESPRVLDFCDAPCHVILCHIVNSIQRNEYVIEWLVFVGISH